MVGRPAPLRSVFHAWNFRILLERHLVRKHRGPKEPTGHRLVFPGDRRENTGASERGWVRIVDRCGFLPSGDIVTGRDRECLRGRNA